GPGGGCRVRARPPRVRAPRAEDAGTPGRLPCGTRRFRRERHATIQGDGCPDGGTLPTTLHAARVRGSWSRRVCPAWQRPAEGHASWRGFFVDGRSGRADDAALAPNPPI